MSDWQVRMSTSKGLPYFYSPSTAQSSWDPPAGLTQEEIDKLPGAEHLKTSKASGREKPGQVRASHLLVKHRDSRRPSSWKEANITRSKEEAIQTLREYQAEINDAHDKAHDKFAELAGKHSDCSSHTHGGDLGSFGRGQMQKPFEDAAYGLKVGEISDIIETDSGVHLVSRTG